MIILTGGAGFIGSCFLRRLNDEGIRDILVVDDLENTDKWKNLVGKNFIDYMNKDDFRTLVINGGIDKLDYIIHMGACSSTTCTDNEYLIKNNYEYSKILALYAMQKNAPFMYASSAATYGDGANGYDDRHSSVHDLKPLNMYGYSKQLFDIWVLKNGYEKRLTGLKFFNVYGPNEYHKEDMRSVVCKKFFDVEDRSKIELFKSYHEDYNDGEQKRDFIYVKDAIEVMWYLYKNPDKTGIFNLGTGQAHSWNELAQAMFKALGKKENIQYIDMPEYLKSKYQYFTQAKMDKLRDAGYTRDFMNIEDAVADYVSYLKEEKCW